jgi:hypothetical protein
VRCLVSLHNKLNTRSSAPPSIFAMTLSKRKTRPVTGVFGTLHVSPLKKHDKRKTSTFVTRLGHDIKLQSLRDKMQRMLAGKESSPEPATALGVEDGVWEDVSMSVDEDVPVNVASAEQVQPSDAAPYTRRLLPNATDHRLFDRWKEIMPTLVDPLILYMASTNGKTLHPKEEIKSPGCSNESSCTRHTRQILCLFLDCMLYPSSLEHC